MERVTLSLRGVPLRAALERLFQGVGMQVLVEGGVPDAPVTLELREVSREVGLRALLRASGIAGLVAREGEPAASESVQGCAAGGRVLNVAVSAAFSSPAGFSTGPNGARIPNQAGSQIRTARRVPEGRPAFLGGTANGSAGSSRSGPPLLPSGSRLQSRAGGSMRTFVTVTVLPEPEPERRRRPGR